MRDNDGRKLDHKTLEALRIRAVERVGEGAHPEDVAAALGLHRKTVYAWLAKYREGGKDALKARAVPGRPPKLGGPQLSRLYALISGYEATRRHSSSTPAPAHRSLPPPPELAARLTTLTSLRRWWDSSR